MSYPPTIHNMMIILNTKLFIVFFLELILLVNKKIIVFFFWINFTCTKRKLFIAFWPFIMNGQVTQ